MATRHPVEDSPDLAIDGEVFTEQDLVNDENLATLVTPEGVDQEWLLGELWKDLERGEHAEAVLAEAEMRRVIELNRSLEHRFVDGVGQVVARLPLSVATHWCARYGHQFFADRSNLDFLAKRNPGFLIETKGRTQIVVERSFGASSSPAPAADAAAEGIGGNSSGVAQAAPEAAPRVRGRRGRWAR